MVWRLLRPRQWSERICRNAERIAEHRWAMGIIFLIELAGCTLIPFPVALIMVALITAAPEKWARFALAATLGSVVGGLALYIIGYAFFNSMGQPLISFYGTEEKWAGVVDWFNGEWGVSFVLFAGVTTGLFRVASIGAGFTEMDPFLFVIILFVSRCVRWFIECCAIKYVGGHIKTWPRQYFRYATAGVVALLVATIVVVSFVV